MLKIGQFDHHWTLPSRMDTNPIAWMIEVNGFIVDARHMTAGDPGRGIRKGLIPYIPGDRADDSAEE